MTGLSVAVIALVLGLLVVTMVVRARSSSRWEANDKLPDPPGLRTVAVFEAPGFVAKEEEDDEDPPFWGKALLEEILPRLHRRFAIADEDVGGSYGYGVVLEADANRWDVSVGYRDPDWLLFVGGGQEREPVPDVPASRELLERLDQALREIDGVSKLRWLDRASFEANEEDGRVEPVA